MDPRVNGRRLEQVVSLQETRARVVPKKIGIMPSVLVAPLVFSVGRVESPGGLRGGLDSYIRWGIHSTGRACWNAWPGWKHDSRVAGSFAGNPGLNTWRCRLPESKPFSGRTDFLDRNPNSIDTPWRLRSSCMPAVKIEVTCTRGLQACFVGLTGCQPRKGERFCLVVAGREDFDEDSCGLRDFIRLSPSECTYWRGRRDRAARDPGSEDRERGADVSRQLRTFLACNSCPLGRPGMKASRAPYSPPAD
jgi:hypothetical protein